MTESPYAVAHDFALMVPAPDGVDDAIAAVMARHEAELDAVLERYGVALGDLLQPTWMRSVRVGDVEALRSPSSLSDQLAEAASRPLREPCCGPGEACSSPECTGRALLPLAVDGEACDPAACGGGCSRSAAAPAVDGVYVTDQLRDVESFGEVFPEPRQDAAVLGAPGIPMSGPVFGRGSVRGDDE